MSLSIFMQSSHSSVSLNVKFVKNLIKAVFAAGPSVCFYVLFINHIIFVFNKKENIYSLHLYQEMVVQWLLMWATNQYQSATGP